MHIVPYVFGAELLPLSLLDVTCIYASVNRFSVASDCRYMSVSRLLHVPMNTIAILYIVTTYMHTYIHLRERERERQTDRQTDRQTETETDRDRDRETETQRQRDRDRDRQTDRQR